MDALGEVRDLAEAVVRRRSLRLWDVQIAGAGGRALVRVLVDADGGIDLDTVAEVSEEISRGLDVRDPLPGRYTLEVSSPGLERALRAPEHWAQSVGRRVVVKTTEVLHGDGHRFEGEVVAAGDRSARVRLDDGELELPYDKVRSARTMFEWGSG